MATSEWLQSFNHPRKGGITLIPGETDVNANQAPFKTVTPCASADDHREQTTSIKQQNSKIVSVLTFKRQETVTKSLHNGFRWDVVYSAFNSKS
eukprot:417487_1